MQYPVNTFFTPGKQLSGIVVVVFFFTLSNFIFFNLPSITGVQITSLLFIQVITWFCYPKLWIFDQIWTIFQSRGSGIWPKNCKKIQTPPVTPTPRWVNIDTRINDFMISLSRQGWSSHESVPFHASLISNYFRTLHFFLQIILRF